MCFLNFIMINIGNVQSPKKNNYAVNKTVYSENSNVDIIIKRIAFSNVTTVMEIPSKKYYADIKKSLWWSSDELNNITRVALDEINKFNKIYPTFTKQHLKYILYQPLTNEYEEQMYSVVEPLLENNYNYIKLYKYERL